MKRIIIISTLLIILFSQCQKREDLIIGKWGLAEIETPFGNNIEQWTFDENNTLKIIGINNFPTDTVKNMVWKYSFDNRRKLRLYRDDGKYTAEYYKIVKLDDHVLNLQLIEAVSQTNYEFYRE